MRARVLLRWRSHAATSETRRFATFDSPIEALTAQDADLDFDHIEPTRMPGRVVELDAP